MGLMSDIPVTFTHDQLYRRMVVESVANTSLLALFKDIVPKSAELIRSFTSPLSKFAETPTNRLDNRQREALLKKIKTVNFLAYEDTVVAVPEGLDTKLVPYLQVLVKQSDLVAKHGLKMIQDYNIELGMFLSNADIRTSLKSHSQHYQAVRQERESYQKLINAHFSKKNPTLSRRRISDVIDRFADLELVFRLEQELLEIRGETSHTTVISELNRAADMLTLIRARLDGDEIGNVSNQVAKNLAEGAYEVAKYAEYMGIYAFYLETATASIANMAEQLNGLFMAK